MALLNRDFVREAAGARYLITLDAYYTRMRNPVYQGGQSEAPIVEARYAKSNFFRSFARARSLVRPFTHAAKLPCCLVAEKISQTALTPYSTAIKSQFGIHNGPLSTEEEERR